MQSDILDIAKTCGASLAGIAPLDSEVRDRVGLPAAVAPDQSFTDVLVLALAHGEDRPELDWWGGPGGTEGNRRLQETSAAIRRILAQEHGVHSHPLPYHPWKGGILLKNAAALAGLGVIGANNLLITPQYGPRVRLRALLLEGRQKAHRNPAPSPCDGCDRPCWRACPQDAFASGAYDRRRCAIQMEQDEARQAMPPGDAPDLAVVKYCRACELACPVGK
jgi:epoxyqueuosine reductase